MDTEGVVDNLSGYAQLIHTRACAVCGSNAGTETSHERLDIVGIGRVRIGYGYCVVCGHVYQVAPAPTEKLDEYYAKFGNYTLNFNADAISVRLEKMLSGVSAQSVYEVGCGTGRHLNYLRRHIPNVGGCEPSKLACEASWNQFGITIDCGTEEECLPNRRGQELIIYSGVLEHLPDPVASLKRAHAAMTPTGHLLIEVPCAVSPESLPPGWFAFEHLHYFTQDAIFQMLARSGFKVIEARINYRDFIYPVITVLAFKTDECLHRPMREQAEISRQFIDDYSKRDAEIWARSSSKLFGLGRHFVWGAGVHTSQLFDRIPGSMDSAVAIIDRDPQKRGQRVGGIPVISPSDYEGMKSGLPVVISSYANEAEIAEGLKGKRVVRLYA